ncbi:hypothetical protein MCHI_001104, partial [Candidatus Magnetoovum chiemensis]
MIVKVSPAIVNVPLRDEPVVFADTVYPTAPLPVPLAPLSTLIHESFDDAVHAQLLSDGVTVTLPEPPP